MEDVIVNKVAESGLITIDLEKFYPGEETSVFDLKDHLFMGLILKEKEFREQLKNLDLQKYQNKNVCITCSQEAVIPIWAYMLAATYLQPVAKEVLFGDEDFMHRTLFLKNLSQINVNDFIDTRVVIKGCGEKSISETAYVEITKLLRPVVKSIMYGEPCSTVPIYKRSKSQVASRNL
jgi:predicted RNA-binding protein